MTRLILSILLFSSIACFGQTKTLPDTVTKIKVTSTFFAIPGKTYVDSVQMDMTKTYLDPDNIKHVRVFKGNDAKLFSGSKGATLITRKNKNPFIKLSDIRLDSIKSIDTTLLTIFVIDGILIDTTSVWIEATTIKSIDILKSDINPELFYDTKKNVFILTTKKKYRKKNGY